MSLRSPSAKCPVRPRRTLARRPRSAWSAVLIGAAMILFDAFPAGASDADEAIARYLDENYPRLEALYREIHERPELSFQEESTAGKLAGVLEAEGFTVTRGIGGHGIVGVLANGEGPTLLIRTDMDALPIVEETGLPYASRRRSSNERGEEVGVMHACGHDAHMAVWSGVAGALAKLAPGWRGTLVMIGQPAEERGAGARAMLEDGLYTRFPRPDHALALHVDSGLEAGRIGYVPGYCYANVDSVDVLVRGRGGHGAYPNLTLDPIVLASQIVLALQTIVSRELPATEPAVVTVGSIHGGTQHNIIPDEVRMQLTVRTYSDATRDTVLRAIERIARETARAARIPEDLLPVVSIKDEYTPALYNDPALAERVVSMWERTLGAERMVRQEAAMVGEDFGRYGRETPPVPIFLFQLGSVSGERIAASRQAGADPLPSLHSSRYHPEVEPTIRTGVRAMTLAALELLGRASAR